MTRKIKTLAALLLMVAGAGVFFVTFARATLYAPETEAEPTQAQRAIEERKSPEDAPARLRIPALGIDANVQHVGVKPNGQMANPNNFTDVGWYKYGTTPGNLGSAVMAGHVDNGLSLAGVFKNLEDAKPGDAIEVETAGGEILRFRVERVVSYDYKQVPAEALFNRADTARLNLITCDGAWIAGEKTYDRRLVVYAVMEP